MFMNACVGVLARLQIVFCISILLKALIRDWEQQGRRFELPPTNKLHRLLQGEHGKVLGDISPSSCERIELNKLSLRVNFIKINPDPVIIKSVALISEESLLRQHSEDEVRGGI